jgi:hypothetical protein
LGTEVTLHVLLTGPAAGWLVVVVAVLDVWVLVGWTVEVTVVVLVLPHAAKAIAAETARQTANIFFITASKIG